MAISSAADLRAALRTTILFDVSGTGSNDAAGTYENYLGGAAGNTANGVVPTDANSVALPDFGGAGHITSLEMSSSNTGWVTLFDRVFACGAYAFNSGTTTLASQPSYSGRLQVGYEGLQLWGFNSTSFNAAPSATITYTDQSGNTGHSTTASWTQGSSAIFPIALASGDSGISKIESVTITTAATAGAVNFVVMRPLCRIYLPTANIPETLLFDRCHLARVYNDSCLCAVHRMASGGVATTSIRSNIEIASK